MRKISIFCLPSRDCIRTAGDSYFHIEFIPYRYNIQVNSTSLPLYQAYCQEQIDKLFADFFLCLFSINYGYAAFGVRRFPGRVIWTAEGGLVPHSSLNVFSLQLLSCFMVLALHVVPAS